MNRTNSLPTSARVVVIGGGIMGCGIAYHLAHEGWKDVVLLEKAELASGSTWHAAGQITQSVSNIGLGRCVGYNIDLYSGKLEAKTGQSVTWHGCGSIRLAYTEDEMDWLRHTISVGRALGFCMELITSKRIAELHPFYNLDGIIGGLHTPDDGHVDPSGVTHALAIGARTLGVKIIRRCRATDINMNNSGEWIVKTDQGDITCEHVVNAAGTYARQIGEWNSLQLPMTSMTHHYLVTDTVPEFLDLRSELPVIRDDRMVSGYVRMEQKSGLIGIYEKESPNTVWLDECPWEAENELFEVDYDRIMPWLDNAFERMPVLSKLGIKRGVHGAISHPPDGHPLIGPAPKTTNYWCCCGTQIGIGWGPGLTRELARWMVHGAADISMREFDPRRFGDYANKKWQVIKAKEDYCLRHEIPFPHFNRNAGRPVKRSALYHKLMQKGAVFEEVFGHERPRWFAKNGIAQHDHYSFKRNELHDILKNEIQAVRERVGLMDITAFTKVEVSGTDAQAFIDRLVANRLPTRKNGIILTHLLNRRGRIEIELTVARISQKRFYLICAAFFEQRLVDHLNQYRINEDVTIENLTDQWSAVAIQGPRSRDVLGTNTDAALDNANFPWLTAQQISIVGKPAVAMRLSYAGELGWEIHCPNECMPAIYDSFWESGIDYRITDYGSFAMNTMRMEKMFKGANELTNEVTLPEADVMRFVKLKKGDFVGRAATEASSTADNKWLCVYLSIEPDGIYDGHGGEAVIYKDKCIGSTTSMAFSHTVGKILAFAYIDPEFANPNLELEVLIAGNPRQATLLERPVYDPENIRPRTDAL